MVSSKATIGGSFLRAGPTLTAVAEAIADIVVGRLAELIANDKTADTPIPIANVVAHGAPSCRWVLDRSRKGHIAVRGPRGARYVMASDLRALVASTKAARRRREEKLVLASAPSITDDAANAMRNLVYRHVGSLAPGTAVRRR